MVKVAIAGAAGRMGRTLIELARDSDAINVTGAFEHPQSSLLGQDAGTVAGIGWIGVPIVDSIDALDEFDVAIDFNPARINANEPRPLSASG